MRFQSTPVLTTVLVLPIWCYLMIYVHAVEASWSPKEMNAAFLNCRRRRPTTKTMTPFDRTTRFPQHRKEYMPLPAADQNNNRRTAATTQLQALLRPDWLRKASKVKQIRQRRNRADLESLSTKAAQGSSDDESGRLYQCCNPSTINMNYANSKNSSSKSGSSESIGRSMNWNEQLLNVYLLIPETDYEATDETNIMGQLRHGEVVRSMTTTTAAATLDTSTGSTTKPNNTYGRICWIEHDKGGWSPTVVDGMTRLIPIDENDDGNNNINDGNAYQ
jgi:hypothetical protein